MGNFLNIILTMYQCCRISFYIMTYCYGLSLESKIFTMAVLLNGTRKIQTDKPFFLKIFTHVIMWYYFTSIWKLKFFISFLKLKAVFRSNLKVFILKFVTYMLSFKIKIYIIFLYVNVGSCKKSILWFSLFFWFK